MLETQVPSGKRSVQIPRESIEVQDESGQGMPAGEARDSGEHLPESARVHEGGQTQMENQDVPETGPVLLGDEVMIEGLSQDELQLRDEQSTPHQVKLEENDMLAALNLLQSDAEPEFTQNRCFEEQRSGPQPGLPIPLHLLSRDNQAKCSPTHLLATQHISHVPL